MKVKKDIKIHQAVRKNKSQEKTYPIPSWVPVSSMSEKELCPDCFKVVGESSLMMKLSTVTRHRLTSLG